MKAASIFVALAFSVLGSIALEKKDPLVYSAIKSIFDTGFESFSGRVDYVSCGLKHGPSEILIKKLLRSRKELTSVEVSNCDVSRIKLNTSTFLSFDSILDFRNAISKIEWQTPPTRRHRHLVHTFNATANEISEVLFEGWPVDSAAF